MKYIFGLDLNLITVKYIIPVSCSKWLVLKNLRLDDAPLQTHALTLNPTHSKILVVSQTSGHSWSDVKPVNTWCPKVAYNWLHILLIMGTFRYVAIIFDISKLPASGLEHGAKNSLISSFKPPFSLYITQCFSYIPSCFVFSFYQKLSLHLFCKIYVFLYLL